CARRRPRREDTRLPGHRPDAVAPVGDSRREGDALRCTDPESTPSAPGVLVGRRPVSSCGDVAGPSQGEPQLSLEPLQSVRVEPDVKIPMRDGVRLSATIWRPELTGRYPVILERVPYELVARCAPYAEYFAQRGYVFVGQNLRGTHRSEGTFQWPTH